MLGGSGYVNEHPVEMMYRDNRLNPIHEGTTGIQSLDSAGAQGTAEWSGRLQRLSGGHRSHDRRNRRDARVGEFSAALAEAVSLLKQVTESLLGGMMEKNIDLVLANSVKYLDLFGNVVIAWMWLRQGAVAALALSDDVHDSDEKFYRGKLQAMQYFYRYELPEISVWAKILLDLDDTCYAMSPDWF